jgi:hypothetical protein
MHYKLYYCGEYNNTLVTFANANYGSDLDDIKSHSDYFHFFNNGPIPWICMKQQCVVCSTIEA